MLEVLTGGPWIYFRGTVDACVQFVGICTPTVFLFVNFVYFRNSVSVSGFHQNLKTVYNLKSSNAVLKLILQGEGTEVQREKIFRRTSACCFCLSLMAVRFT